MKFVGCLFVVAAPLVMGCSGTTVVLKAPLDDQCSSSGLRGCPEITEGMLLYAQGDKAAALPKLALGAGKNSPADIQKLAKALEQLESVPGADAYVASISEAVNVMVQHAGPAAPSVTAAAVTEACKESESSSAGRTDARDGMLTADTDPKQALGAVISDVDSGPRIGWCADMAGEPAACRSAARGPLYVTDVESLGSECVGQFLAVAQGKSVRFVLDGPFHIHGARLLVREDEWFFVGQRDGAAPPKVEATKKSKDAKETVVLDEVDPRRQCKLLWNGFKPYAPGPDEAAFSPAEARDDEELEEGPASGTRRQAKFGGRL